ncbi:hypothetical protein BpHYR1_034912 [Brachionus plicatilis]|uniref:Uncharacterized protein n=1 Tax=Brachionus plicatilis TaxID=10195 RepID=A0A3M7RXZ0_BRAPC|nr:hypothetical protein BpHYR1_034912 [Brachionus plicatilis]
MAEFLKLAKIYGKSPSKSLDLNPIEMIWNEKKEFVRKRNIQNDEEANKGIKIVIKKWRLVEMLGQTMSLKSNFFMK